MHKRFISALTLPVLIFGSQASSAQKNEIKLEEYLNEVVVVTGFRRSLANAIHAKKNASTILDAIYAEDIGKSSDQNIAEALSRVTGISIQRVDGEGVSISVRGAGPNLNNIYLNGVELTSSDENQTVDFSAYSSDILTAVEVIKGSSANHDEGSLGAQINLKSVRPLELDDNRRAAEVQLRSNTFAEENDYKLSGSITEKLMDDKLGLALTAFLETQSVRKDQYWAGNPVNSVVPAASDSRTGASLTPDPGDTGIRGITHSATSYQLLRNNRDRAGFTGTVQFLPTDQTEIDFDLTFSESSVAVDNNSVSVLGADSGYRFADPGNPADPGDPLEDFYILDSTTKTFLKNVNRLGRGRLNRVDSETTSQNTIFGINAEHVADDFILKVRGGYAKTNVADDHYFEANTNNFLNIDNNQIGPNSTAIDIQPVGFDCTSGRCVLVGGQTFTGPGGEQTAINPATGIASSGFSIDAIDDMHIQQLSIRDRRINDESFSLYADLEWNIGYWGIDFVETGVKLASRNKRTINQFLIADRGDVSFADVTDSEAFPYNDFMSGLGYLRDSFTDGWTMLDARKAFEVASQTTPLEFNNDKTDERKITQDIFAAYVKLNFSYAQNLVFGDAGLRMVKTDINSEGYNGLGFNNSDVHLRDPFNVLAIAARQPGDPGYDPLADPSVPGFNFYHPDFIDTSTVVNPEISQARGESSDTILLPSLNLNSQFSESLIGRAAVSKTMARPRIDSLKPAYKIFEDVWRPESSAVLGAPDLKPLESNNLDLSLEWYFAEGATLSGALFFKDMKNFEETATFSSGYRDFRGALTAPTDYDQLLTALDDTTNCMPDRYPAQRGIQDLALPATCDILITSVARNGKGGSVQGLELGYTQNFSFLPGLFSGLGAQVNYTYADSEADQETDETLGQEFAALPLANTSRHTFNLTGFWEQDGHLIRLSYNHRTDSLAQRGFFNGALWNKGEGRLDLSANYAINDLLTVTFQGVNLLDTTSVQYYTSTLEPGIGSEGNALDGDAPTNRIIREWHTGPLYRIGLRATF